VDARRHSLHREERLEQHITLLLNDQLRVSEQRQLQAKVLEQAVLISDLLLRITKSGSMTLVSRWCRRNFNWTAIATKMYLSMQVRRLRLLVSAGCSVIS
jgi:hypothetical protein